MTNKDKLIKRLSVGDDDLPFVTLSETEAAEIVGYLLPKPEHPESGTFVEFRFKGYRTWVKGMATKDGVLDSGRTVWPWNEIEYHPVTALQLGQIAIDVPNIGVWPLTREKKPASRASLIWHFYDREGACFSQMTAKHGAVSYAEAEEMQQRESKE